MSGGFVRTRRLRVVGDFCRLIWQAVAMNKIVRPTLPIPERLRRPATPELEAAALAEARAEVAAGKWVAADRVHAWLDSLGTEHELPMPTCE
jgi:hypothetical protein